MPLLWRSWKRKGDEIEEEKEGSMCLLEADALRVLSAEALIVTSLDEPFPVKNDDKYLGEEHDKFSC